MRYEYYIIYGIGGFRKEFFIGNRISSAIKTYMNELKKIVEIVMNEYIELELIEVEYDGIVKVKRVIKKWDNIEEKQYKKQNLFCFLYC